MWFVCGRKEMHNVFWWGNLKDISWKTYAWLDGKYLYGS
jgi:hypothetical protein